MTDSLLQSKKQQQSAAVMKVAQQIAEATVRKIGAERDEALAVVNYLVQRQKFAEDLIAHIAEAPGLSQSRLLAQRYTRWQEAFDDVHGLIAWAEQRESFEGMMQ